MSPDRDQVKGGMRLLVSGALLLALAAVGSWAASPLPRTSLPWVVLLILAASGLLLAAWAPVRRLITPARLAWGLLALGYAFLALAVVGTRWPGYKLPWLSGVYALLPTLRPLPFAAVADGIQPNQAGGILASLAVFAVALPFLARPEPATRALRAAGLVLAVLAAAVVVLTGSRAALAGGGAGALFLLGMRDRRWLWLPGSAALLGSAVLVLRPSAVSFLAGLLLRDETLDTKLLARLDIWLSAFRGIEDHAVTGIGLGIFNEVIPVRYPYESVGLSYTVSQAHNVFLDTALTLGLPGLLGLVLLLAGIVWLGSGGAREGRTGRPDSALIPALHHGLLSAAIVFVVFGLTDALSFSTPSSLVLWFCAASLATLQGHRE